jgi:transposase
MNSIFYVGMDVHKETVRIAVLKNKEKETVYEGTHKSDVTRIVRIVKAYTEKGEVVAGYEAGCMGYTLQRALAKVNVECRVIPPNQVPRVGSQRIKTDSRDAILIARMLKNNEGGGIHVPTPQDEATRDLLRCRDDMKLDMNRCKQRISKFLLRLGHVHDKESTWTKAHREWMKGLAFANCLHKETLDQYYSYLVSLEDRLDRLDTRIKEMAVDPAYQENVARLRCFKGIDYITSLALVCEVGGFHRFPNAGAFMAYVGLVPSELLKRRNETSRRYHEDGEHTSTQPADRIEQHYRYYSSPNATLKKRRAGNSEVVIDYADRALRRLQSKHAHLVRAAKNPKTATTAVARELAGFVWGMMTENYDRVLTA